MNKIQIIISGTSLIIIAILFMAYEHIIDLGPTWLPLFVSVAAIANGIASIILSVHSNRTSKFEAIKEYYQQGDTSEMTKMRNLLYQYSELPLEKKDPCNEEYKHAASQICSFFSFWGLMQKDGYLPMNIFRRISGHSVSKSYSACEDYISNRRIDNPLYAKEFEDLVKRIKKHTK